MNKNMIKKGILVLALIALLPIISGGCTIIGSVTIPIRGTVYITIDEDYTKPIVFPTYYIFMDYDFKGTINSYETLELRKVPLGNHFFEAIDTSGWHYGYTYQEIFSGINYVEIPVELAY